MLSPTANLAHLAVTLLDSKRPRARLQRLKNFGHVDELPNAAQLWIAARDRIFRRPKKKVWSLHRIRRFAVDPAAMLDRVGLFASADSIIHRLLQTAHADPYPYLELLRAHERGLAKLEEQILQFQAGTHRRQGALERLLDDPAYPPRLLRTLHRFMAEPHARDGEDLSGVEPYLALAIDQFKDLRGFTNYASRLDVTMSDVGVAAFEVAVNHTVGLALGVTLGPKGYRLACCDPALREKHLGRPRNRTPIAPANPV